MINRILIRIKVLQIVYAHYQKSNTKLAYAENELMRSLQKSYDLYHYLLLLINVLTDLEQKKIDALQYKFLFAEEDRNPNMRFANNRLAEQLRNNEQLASFANQYGYLWEDEDRPFLRDLLKEILQSDIYKEYLQTPDTYESDKSFWCKALKDIVLINEKLEETLEEKDIYWEGNLENVGTFVYKTVKRFNANDDTHTALYPMFRDDEDKQFALTLLHKTILESKENDELINAQIKNWDLERIAQLDLYIMQMALTELKHLPNIPVNVTLNEYIELAHDYSTPKSALFINGVLDKIVSELKNDGKLFKN